MRAEVLTSPERHRRWSTAEKERILLEADAAGQKVSICGLTPHFTKVFTMVGIPKYAALFPTPAEAVAAL